MAVKTIIGICLGVKGVDTYIKQKREHKRLRDLGQIHGPLPWDSSPPWYRNDKKNALVIGSGVAGVSSAYELAALNYHVVVLDASDKISNECSKNAAGGMQKMNPLVDYELLKSIVRSFIPSYGEMKSKLLGSETRESSAEKFRFFRIGIWNTLTDPFFLRWAWNFYQHCFLTSPQLADYRQSNMLLFTGWAIDDLIHLMHHGPSNKPHDNRIAKRCGLVQDGALKLLYEPITSDTKRSWSQHDIDSEPTEIINRDQVAQMEPWVKDSNKYNDLQGAVFQASAASGNCEWLTLELAESCKSDYGVQFVNNVHVTGFQVQDSMPPVGLSPSNPMEKKISAVQTNRGDIPIPENAVVVVAAGSWSPILFRMLGVYLPLYPLKGYNITISGDALQKYTKDQLPTRIIGDGYVYTTHFRDTVLKQEELRITSIGELNAWNTNPTFRVESDLRSHAKYVFPKLSEVIDKSPVRVGLRPFVFDGLLMIGHVPVYSNAFVNAGPGFNGWKCATGAAKVLASVISGDKTMLPGSFDPQIFSPQGRMVYSPKFCKLWEVFASI